jgi:hypothetical protein
LAVGVGGEGGEQATGFGCGQYSLHDVCGFCCLNKNREIELNNVGDYFCVDGN